MVSSSPPEQPEPDSRVERAERLLRQGILGGALPQGSRLSEVRLAKEYGLSRGPVREALRGLERARLVTSVPNGGTFVVRLTAIQVVETLELRALLEPFAFEHATTPRWAPLATRLQGVLNQMADRLEAGDHAALPGLHGAFHASFYLLARNTTLTAMWAQLEGPTELHVLSQVTSAEAGAALLDEHRELADALMQGNVADGRRALLRHLRSAAAQLDVPFLPRSPHVMAEADDE